MANPFTLDVVGFGVVMNQINEISEFATGGQAWVVAPNVEYAGHVEYGTVHMSAQPYMRPAAEQVANSLGSEISGAGSLDEAIEMTALAVEKEAKRRAPVDTGALRDSIAAEPA